MKPDPQQVEASQFIFERDSSMLFARTGTGKTITYLLSIEDMIKSKAFKRVLVSPPLRVAKLVWMQERSKWGIDLSIALCTGEVGKIAQRAAIETPTDVLLVNHDILGKVIEDGTHGCDALIIDELSRFRNGTGKWQKSVRHAPFRFKSGGTGTPAPNGLMSLYGMSQAVGYKGFGRNYDKWLRTYFYPTNYDQTQWEPFKDTPAALAEIIRPFTFTLESQERLPPIVRPRIDVDLPPKLRQQYDCFRATSVLSDYDIIAGSNAVLRGKLRQMASGFVYDRKDVLSFDAYRMDAVEQIVNEQNGEPILIAYEFTEQLEFMRRRWPDLRWIGGGSSDDETTVNLWNTGKLDKLAIHPQSAGHGLNLQGGGNSIVWWQTPDDLELFQQLLGRLARRGQAEERVWSYEIGAVGTIDEEVRRRAVIKDERQEGLWDALKRNALL